MTLTHRAKIALLGLGDLIALYASLFAALFLRYGAHWQDDVVHTHFVPFSIIFVLWIGVFYVAGLYDLRRLRNNIEFIQTLWLTLAANAALAIMFFYLVPTFGITPKTNLFLFIAIFACFEIIWRRFFNRITALSQPLAHVALVGESEGMTEINTFLESNPQFGFKVDVWVKDSKIEQDGHITRTLHDALQHTSAKIIVVKRELKRDPELAKLLYELFASGKTIHDIPSFYEEVFRKVPITEINEDWFLDQIAEQHRFYDGLKQAFEVLSSIILTVILSPILLLAAILIKLSSRGPVIYKQTRVGKGGAHFTLYKFRSMRADAEQSGAQWASHKDPRSTWIGQVLRVTHLDELPQLVNIMKGDISFVGPRPERPEFIEKLAENVPYYESRLLVKPGVTGWAQIHHHKDLTTADVIEKLKYDVYYLKHRSLVIDLAIVIKTIKTLFSTPQ
jgi:exopolysaccharide biosynthesis polyprenyl glycosylphosphotransferase